MARRRTGRPLPWLAGVIACVLPLWGATPAVAVGTAATAAAPQLETSVTRAAGPGAAGRLVPPGGLITYTLTVTNKGPSVARNVTATDTLPENIVFESSKDGCTAVGQKVSCGPEAELAVGKSKTWTFVARLKPSYEGTGDDLGNAAVTDSGTTDPDKENNTNPPVVPPGPFDPKADLVATKSVVQTKAVAPGESFLYTLTVTNRGLSDARNVKATDTLPRQLNYVSSDDECTETQQNVTCGPVPVLAPGASVSWTFEVQLDQAYTGDGKDLPNTATARSDTPDPDTRNNTSDQVYPQVDTPKADVRIDKTTVTDIPVAPGETFQYAVRVTNDGPSRAEGVSIEDTLPSRLTFVESPDGCTALGQRVSCGTLATLDAGASRTWIFTVKLDSGYTGDGSDIQNIATVTSETSDPDTSNNTSRPAGVPGNKVNPPTADLSVVKEPVGDTPPVPGTEFQYRITVANDGPSSDAHSVTLTDKLPEELTYVSTTPSGCTYDGDVVRCARTTPLKVGEKVEYLLTVRLDPSYTGDGTDILNGATVTAANIDPNSKNDTSTTKLPGGRTGTPSADLKAQKKLGSSTPISPGETFPYEITVTNHGPSEAKDVKATDTLPAQLSFVSSASGCTAAGKTVTCGPEAKLGPNESRTWTITVRLAPDYTGDGSDITNTATVSSTTADPDSGNDSSTVTGVPGSKVDEAKADLEVDKEATETKEGTKSPGPAQSGEDASSADPSRKDPSRKDPSRKDPSDAAKSRKDTSLTGTSATDTSARDTSGTD
ncbi:DUF11 domain-containing protein [Streptomyces roseicoloratus]|uniref:DUF11 domain-containing protein n=1 Tax=Streptomyces roseicoloratus TaxID=2508722 RepID=A0ABY9RRX7_9ACTN|nr:DUF11 domain-containing protein [Streptomyces roseicoloratus]WMX44513.1 DUF11 domain-containing protein [Streptomyces roseicoloratus]